MKRERLEDQMNSNCTALSCLADFDSNCDKLSFNDIALCALMRVIRYGSSSDIAMAIDLYSDFSYARNELKSCDGQSKDTSVSAS